MQTNGQDEPFALSDIRGHGSYSKFTFPCKIAVNISFSVGPQNGGMPARQIGEGSNEWILDTPGVHTKANSDLKAICTRRHPDSICRLEVRTGGGVFPEQRNKDFQRARRRTDLF